MLFKGSQEEDTLELAAVSFFKGFTGKASIGARVEFTWLLPEQPLSSCLSENWKVCLFLRQMQIV